MADYIYGSGDGNNNGTPENGNSSPESGAGTSDGGSSGGSPTGNQTNGGYTNGYSSGGSNGGYNGGYYGGNQYPGYQYGNGYQYNQTPPTPPTPPKKHGGKTAVVVVTIIVVTVLLSVSVFAAAYMLAARNEGQPGDPASTDTAESVGSTGPQSAGIVLAPDSLGTKDKGTYAEVVSKVADSVVEIVTEHASSNSFYYTQGAGSGVVIDAGGYIITNNHVVTNNNNTYASKITVRLTNGKTFEASVVGADSDSDIAVLKIDAGVEKLTPAVIGTSSTLAVGEEIVLIGNPLGTLGGSVTNGIISALDREITVEDETMNLMQTNAAVNPGNSGGGMFNMAGELIGIVNAKYSETGIEGLGFAIPIDDAVSVANELLDHGYVKGRVSLHIQVVSITSVEQMMKYHVNNFGVYVIEAEDGYNDDVLQSGDRIVQVDGVEITDFADLKAVLKGHKVGDTLSAFVVRNGSYIEIRLECFEKTVSDVQFEEETGN